MISSTYLPALCVCTLVTLVTGPAQIPAIRGGISLGGDKSTQRNNPCPTISVSCPGDVGKSITFTATVNNLNPSLVLTYNWEVSAGSIIEGQGTKDIKVSLPSDGQPVTATVSIGGFNRDCPTTASCTTPIILKAPPAVLVDSYGNPRRLKRKPSQKKCVKPRLRRRGYTPVS